MNEPIQVHYLITPESILHAEQASHRAMVRPILQIGIGIIGVFMVAGSLIQIAVDGPSLLPLIRIPMGCMMTLWVWPLKKWLLNRRLKASRLAGKWVLCKLTENEIHYAVAGEEATDIPWESITHAIIGDAGILLCIPRQDDIWLPFDALTREDGGHALDLVGRKVARVRRIA